MNRMTKIIERRREIISNIEELEAKRKRSEYSLVNCIIRDVKVDEEDVKYFNLYTSKIEIYKEELKDLEDALVELRAEG